MNEICTTSSVAITANDSSKPKMEGAHEAGCHPHSPRFDYKPAGKKSLVAAYKARIGISIAIVIVITVLATGIFSLFDNSRKIINHSTLALSVVCLGLYGYGLRRKRLEQTEADVLRFYRNPRYWAVVFSIATSVTYAITVGTEKSRSARAEVVLAPDTPLAPSPKPIHTEHEIVTEPEFPPIEVTGVMLNGRTSSAIINRMNVRVGETVSGLRVVDISPDHVVVETNGFQKVIHITVAGVSPDVLQKNVKRKR